MIERLPSDIVERYAVLRDHLVQGQWSQSDSGRVVTKHGLLAWSQRAPSRPTPLPPPRPPSGGGVPADLQAPVTHVLASMVLRLHPEVAHGNCTGLQGQPLASAT